MDVLRWLSPLYLVVLACDPVVDANYRGTPVFSFEGQLAAAEGIGDNGHEFRTTLMWLSDLSADPATQSPRLSTAREQSSAAVELQFPSGFRIDLFAPPDDAMLLPGRGLGVALIVVYEDRNGDGRLTLNAQPPELVGGAPYEALVYAKDATAAANAPFGEPVAPGFQLVRIPLFCGDQVDVIPARCETPLGAPCTSDQACGTEGVCLQSVDGLSWPGGACALRYNTVTCEVPEYSGFYFNSDGEAWFIQGCDRDSDCRDGYFCDHGAEGCIPDDDPAFSSAPSLPQGPTLPACPSTVGASCDADSDCGGGTCLLRSNGESFPNGYCAMPIETADTLGCEPDNGVAVSWRFRADGTETDWFRACRSDSDCRVAEGYECDDWLEACLPIAPVALELRPAYTPSAVCFGVF